VLSDSSHAYCTCMQQHRALCATVHHDAAQMHACMQDELAISLKEKDAAVIKAQKEASEAATSADHAKQQADEAVASAKANSEQECKRAQVAANRAIDEYKEHINQVNAATTGVHAFQHATRRNAMSVRCEMLAFSLQRINGIEAEAEQKEAALQKQVRSAAQLALTNSGQHADLEMSDVIAGQHTLRHDCAACGSRNRVAGQAEKAGSRAPAGRQSPAGASIVTSWVQAMQTLTTMQPQHSPPWRPLCLQDSGTAERDQLQKEALHLHNLAEGRLKYLEAAQVRHDALLLITALTRSTSRVVYALRAAAGACTPCRLMPEPKRRTWARRSQH
jgi:hypothetical protein